MTAEHEVLVLSLCTPGLMPSRGRGYVLSANPSNFVLPRVSDTELLCTCIVREKDPRQRHRRAALVKLARNREHPFLYDNLFAQRRSRASVDSRARTRDHIALFRNILISARYPSGGIVYLANRILFVS